MNVKKLCFITGAAIAASFSAVADDFLRGYEALPLNVGFDVRDIRPVFDFDGDGCLPSAAYSKTGVKNGGNNPSGSLGGGCRHSSFLDYSNTYHRYVCKIVLDHPGGSSSTKYCGHMFSLYFKKDMIRAGTDCITSLPFPPFTCIVPNGHRHDFEFAAIFTTDGVVTHGAYSHHGNVTTAAESNIPKTSNGHLKFVYHKDAGTHPMRFAKANETAENSYGRFLTPQIMSWWTMYGDGVTNAQMRTKFNNDWTGDAKPASRDTDDAFVNKMNQAKPSNYPTFSNYDANNSLLSR